MKEPSERKNSMLEKRTWGIKIKNTPKEKKMSMMKRTPIMKITSMEKRRISMMKRISMMGL
jgi:hypothetical protein